MLVEILDVTVRCAEVEKKQLTDEAEEICYFQKVVLVQTMLPPN